MALKDHGPCPMVGCGGTAAFSLSAGGKRKWTCTYCDVSGFAEQGGTAFTRIGASLAPAAAPAPGPAPAAPALAPRPPRTLLDAA